MNTRCGINGGAGAICDGQPAGKTGDVQRRAVGINVGARAAAVHASCKRAVHRQSQAAPVKIRALLDAKNRAVPHGSAVAAVGRQINARIRADTVETDLSAIQHAVAAAGGGNGAGANVDRCLAFSTNPDARFAAEPDWAGDIGTGVTARFASYPHRRIVGAAKAVGVTRHVDRAAGEGVRLIARRGDHFQAGAVIAIQIEGTAVAHLAAAAGIHRQHGDIFTRQRLRHTVDVDNTVIQGYRVGPGLDAHANGVFDF